MEKQRKKRKKRCRMGLIVILLAAILLSGAGAFRLCRSLLRKAAHAEADRKVHFKEETEIRRFTAEDWKTEEENTYTGDTFENENPLNEDSDDEELLTLVNKRHPISQDYTITLIRLKSGHSVDERCYFALQQMMDDCRSAGLSPVICSSYRTWEKQESLYMNQVRELISEGYGEEEAKELAKVSNAVPGTSEHQLGLAIDIVDSNYQLLDEKQEDTPVQKWLMDNSYKYGFILRYPNGKSDITGIIYEPWHYRYVGKKAAREIYERGICLEEYLAGE